ncbi:MAG TPA: hypothetical protein VGM23_13805, partial [Armatimonadota bacterium]
LPLMNGAKSHQHNLVSFEPYGQPTGLVECFTSTPGADYVRSRIAPRAYCTDAMYHEEAQRSGFTRELVFVKAPQPGGVEYLVMKDSVVGPNPPQWNLDVLSRKPTVEAPGRVRFPGHPDPGFGMGLDVIMLEPAGAEVTFEEGMLNPKLKTPEGRTTLADQEVDWTVIEHWLMHVPGAPGTTFLAVLFPRREHEPAPRVEYYPREETLRITHAEGRDIVFLRPNPRVGVSIDGVLFQGRAALARSTGGAYALYDLDAVRLEQADTATPVKIF